MGICLRKQCPADELEMLALVLVSGSVSGSRKGRGILSSCPLCLTGQLGTLPPMSLSGCWAGEDAVAILFSLMAFHNHTQAVGEAGDSEQRTVGLRQIGQGPGSQKREGKGTFSGGRG